MTRAIKITFFFAFLISIAQVSNAQVTIAPTNLFVDSQTKFGTYMVINGSNENQEISISFNFAYSQTDEEGDRRFVHDTAEIAAQYSIADYIRAFPQNFVLTPGQRQVVRIRVNAPNDIDDGTYWARIKTTSTPESPSIELSTTDVVTAHIGITVEQITGLFYKKGEASTGIEVAEIRTEFSDEKELIVLTDLKRTGNSPFLGSITTTLLNEDGEPVQEAFISTSIYFDGTHRQALNIEGLPSGKYTVQVGFESKRSDVSSQDLIQMEPVSVATSVIIPS